MTKRLVVWLTVDPVQEQAFNQWYQEEYIPRFVQQMPGIESVSRWRMPGTTTYLTIYELDRGLLFDEFTAALRAPEREADRKAWHAWEEEHLTDFRDGFFERVFEYHPD